MEKLDLQIFRFEEDGEVPNNPRLPLLVYRGVAPPAGKRDRASWFEKTFAANGWSSGWRNGIHPFRHFHASTHEVLGIAAGRAIVEFGGASGCALTVAAGDVVVLPAGTGHKRLEASADLLVVGAYPRNGHLDQRRPGEIGRTQARAAVAKVPLPGMDPVAGSRGPLMDLWAAG